MAHRNPDQNRRSRGWRGSGGSRGARGADLYQNIPSDGSERTGPTVPLKILRPKSGTYEVLLRTRDESEEEELIICDAYKGPKIIIDSLSEQIMKNTFEKPLELEFDDQLHSSSVIGWSVQTGHTQYINKKLLGITAEDYVPLTDTIFPVIVMGWDEQPASFNNVITDFNTYHPGFYLILLERPSLPHLTIDIEVHLGATPHRIRVPKHRGLLILFSFYVQRDKINNFHKFHKNLGNIHRIVDKDNTDYGIYGMYGGGPLPPVGPPTFQKFRITWDQPRSLDSEDFGLTSMTANFRYDIDLQGLSQRTGFYCSKDALLAANEKADNQERNNPGYTSLLKEYTFVIIDGISNYVMFHNEGDKQPVTFRNPDQTPGPTGPTGPVIVIVPEGISLLRIIENPRIEFYRNSSYFNENATLPPMTLNWQDFQNNFNATAQPPEPQ